MLYIAWAIVIAIVWVFLPGDINIKPLIEGNLVYILLSIYLISLYRAYKGAQKVD